MVNDTLSDMIIRLKNASLSRKQAVFVTYSNLNFAVASLLERTGFVSSVARKGKRGRKYLEVTLRYEGAEPRINGVRRISKPSRRVYIKTRDIKPVKRGYGAIILSKHSSKSGNFHL
jgi:small subunit ribosomal protein S8